MQQDPDLHAFLHDKVMEGALALISEDEINLLKFGIGCILLLCMNALEDHHCEQVRHWKSRWTKQLLSFIWLSPCLGHIFLFLAVNLLNTRLDVLPKPNKLMVCEPNIFAGDEANFAAACKCSAMCCAAAINLLPKNHWTSMCEASLHLFTHAAEVEMCLGHNDEMKVCADEVLNLDTDLTDKMTVQKMCLDALLAQAKIHEAWSLGFDVLKHAGVSCPKSAIATGTTCALTKTRSFQKAMAP